jgi:hypothetical protein
VSRLEAGDHAATFYNVQLHYACAEYKEHNQRYRRSGNVLNSRLSIAALHTRRVWSASLRSVALLARLPVSRMLHDNSWYSTHMHTFVPGRLNQFGLMLTFLGAVLLLMGELIAKNAFCRPSDTWEYAWVHGMPCRAPCWQGIVPGKTSAGEARELLKRLPFVKPDSVKQGSWRSLDGDGGGHLSIDNGVVQAVHLALPSGVRLGDVIDSYGEPSHVAAGRWYGNHGDGPFYSLALVYASPGIVLDASHIWNSKPKISPDMCFDYISLGQAGIHTEILDSSSLAEWQGMQDIETYYDTESIEVGHDSASSSIPLLGRILTLAGIVLFLIGLVRELR